MNIYSYYWDGQFIVDEISDGLLSVHKMAWIGMQGPICISEYALEGNMHTYTIGGGTDSNADDYKYDHDPFGACAGYTLSELLKKRTREWVVYQPIRLDWVLAKPPSRFLPEGYKPYRFFATDPDGVEHYKEVAGWPFRVATALWQAGWRRLHITRTSKSCNVNPSQLGSTDGERWEWLSWV